MIEEAKQYNNIRPSQMYPRKKEGFLKRWFRNAVREAWEFERESQGCVKADAPAPAPSIVDSERSIRFTVHSANGGRVVETYRYDRRKDQNTCGLYVITNDQDFGKEIDKIITMESLK